MDSSGHIENPKNASVAVYIAYILIALMGLSPVVMALVTWDMTGQLTGSAYFIRRFWLFTILVEMVAVFFAIYLKFQFGSKSKPRLSFGFCIWIALIAGFLISGLAAEGLLNQLQLVFWIFHATCLWALYIFAKKFGNDIIDRFWIALSLGTILYFVTFVTFYLLLNDPSNFPWDNRLPGLTNIRHIGYFAGAAAIISVGLMVTRKGRFALFGHVSLFLILVLLLWSGSRGALLAFLLSCAFGFIFVERMRKRKIIVTLCLVMLGASAVSLVLPRPTSSFGVFHRVMATKSIANTSAGRIELWRQTVEDIQSSPLLGHGPADMRYNKTDDPDFHLNHPHNIILQFSYNWGIPLALLMLFFLGSQIKSALDPRKLKMDQAVIPALVLVNMIIFSLYDGTAYYSLPIIISLMAIVQLNSLKDFPEVEH